jgi:hypothetical protein
MKRTALALTLVALSAATMTGCSKSSNVSTASSSAAPAASTGAIVATAGSAFRGKLQQEISSKKSRDGDKFTIENKGEIVNGHLQDVHPAGLGKKPSMVIVFDNLQMPDGTVAAPIDVRIENIGVFGAKSHHLRTIGMMMGGAIAGNMAGHAAHQKHGALAGAAGGYMLSQEMKTDIDVKPGTTIVLKFNKNAIGSATSQQ